MLQQKMSKELATKELLEQARQYAYEYIDGIHKMDVAPSEENIKNLSHFEEPLANESTSAKEVLHQLHTYGSPATMAQTGGRYFGFVNGGAIPAAIGAKWLSDVWDQNGGLYYTSPINAKLETICESWLKDIFNLPKETVAGFVSGTSMANLSALTAARYQLLKNLGWDINKKGLFGAPPIRIVAHQQVHSSIKKTLVILGYGVDCIEWIPADNQGRLIIDELPKLDNSCLLLLQAGNANTGAFDNVDKACDLANEAGAWTHIDGAFGLWAAASKSLSYLTKGMEKASSWAVDGHKTLHTPYDCGIVLCRYPDAMITSLQATGEYIVYSDQRDPMMYGPEMSKRSRAIEMWATMKYLGKDGIDEMVTTFHTRAKQLEAGLRKLGFNMINEVLFNQVLVSCDSDEATKSVVTYLQNSGELWLGGTTWNGKAAIRISICSWQTTEADIEQTIAAFAKAKATV